MAKSEHIDLAQFRGGFNNLDEATKNRIFYLSLFDPSGWELGDNIFFKESEIRYNLIKILKTKEFKAFHRQSGGWNQKNWNYFIESTFYPGHASNHMISFNNRGTFRFIPESKGGRIDLKIKRKGKEIGCIELKRLISTNNIKEEINGFHDKIKSCPIRKKRCKHLFLCLFPIFNDEHIDRVKRFIVGYQNLIPHHTPKSINEIAAYMLPVNEEGKTGDRFVLNHINEIIRGVFKE